MTWSFKTIIDNLTIHVTTFFKSVFSSNAIRNITIEYD